ncbi:MAG: DUF2764 family protein [Bacteroidota bacterium]
MKRNYYYLVAGLQDITLDIHKLSMGQLEFREELRNELHPSDFRNIKVLFFPYDNINLLNLLLKKETGFDERGVFSRETLEENIKEPTGELPAYMDEFIDAVKNDEPIIENMSPENQITTLFYRFTQTLDSEFLVNWFRFNKHLNNLLTASICRKYDIPYENQIIGNDEISEAIRKSHARDFGLAAEIDWLDDLLNIVKKDDVQEREKAVDLLKWRYLDDVTFFEYFTADKIMAFTLKLGMVERWLTLDREHGGKMFMRLLNELKSSYKLPESFTEK